MGGADVMGLQVRRKKKGRDRRKKISFIKEGNEKVGGRVYSERSIKRNDEK